METQDITNDSHEVNTILRSVSSDTLESGTSPIAEFIAKVNADPHTAVQDYDAPPILVDEDWYARCGAVTDKQRTIAKSLHDTLARVGAPLDPDGLRDYVAGLDAKALTKLLMHYDTVAPLYEKMLRRLAGVDSAKKAAPASNDLSERIARVQAKLDGVGDDKALKKAMRDQRRLVCAEMMTAAHHGGVRVMFVHSINANGTCTSDYAKEKQYQTEHGEPMPLDAPGRCHTPGKRPHGLDWNSAAYKELDQIERLFESKPRGPNLNWGVAVGPQDRLMMVDFDGPDGIATFERMRASGEIPETVIDVSGSGGYHAFLRVPEGWNIRNSARAIPSMPGVDIRGEGGQVVCSGSLHKSGRRYQWLPGHSFADVPIADAPLSVLHAAYFASKEGHSEAPDGTKAPPDTMAGRKDAPAPAASATASDNPFAAVGSGLGGGRKSDKSETGFVAKLSHIGDDTEAGQDGCYDKPIFTALCAWFGEHRREVETVDAAPAIEAIRARVIELGPRAADKTSADRYQSDEYLNEQVKKARDFVLAKRAEAREEPEEPELPWGFSIENERGKARLMYTYPAKKGKPDRTVEVCNPIKVLGRVRDERQSGWGKLIEFQNDQNEPYRTVVHDSDIVSNQVPLVSRLANKGLDPSYDECRTLMRFLNTVRCDRTLTNVSSPGWHGTETYTSPLGEAIGPKADEFMLADDCGTQDRKVAGTLEGWQEAANAACMVHQNPYWKLGVLAGFAGVIIDLTGLPTCGINFIGETSKGKSTAQALQASVSSNPKEGRGVRHALRTTNNSIENLIQTGNGVSVAFDELGLVDAQKVSELVFMLSGGIDKARQQASGGLRVQRTWQTFYTLSGERSITQMITEDARQKKREGISPRCLDLSVDGGTDCKAWWMAKVKGYEHNYGHALPVFVRWLIEHGYNEHPELLRSEIDCLTTRLVGFEAQGKLRRAAVTLAILWRVAEIVHGCGLLAPWAPSELFGDELCEWPECGRLALFQQVWGAYQEGEGKSLTQTDSGATEVFLTALRARWGEFAKVGSHLEDRNRVVLGWWDDSYVYIPCSNVTLLVPGLGKTENGIRRVLAGAGVIEKQDKNLVHHYLPNVLGMGGVPHVRVPRDLAPAEIMDEDENDNAMGVVGAGLRQRKGRR
jgi:hypothetical protein